MFTLFWTLTHISDVSDRALQQINVSYDTKVVFATSNKSVLRVYFSRYLKAQKKLHCKNIYIFYQKYVDFTDTS